ncbi:beta-lactamase-like protein, partial [Ochromonadaceae sp. CCMP2298]
MQRMQEPIEGREGTKNRKAQQLREEGEEGEDEGGKGEEDEGEEERGEEGEEEEVEDEEVGEQGGVCAVEITGAWTKAGVGSCVRVQGRSGNKAEDMLFDCGELNSDTLFSRTVFISHSHIDHIGACIAHARARALSSAPATYYVPTSAAAALAQAQRAFELLDGGPIPMNIVPMGVWESVHVTPAVRVQSFPTCHRVPSQGYALYSVKKPTLLPELRGLSGAEIGEIRAMGGAVTSKGGERLEFVYTGDTTFSGLLYGPAPTPIPASVSIAAPIPMSAPIASATAAVAEGDSQGKSNSKSNNSSSSSNSNSNSGSGSGIPTIRSHLLRAHTLVIECTYLDGDQAKALQYGHVHLQDIVQHAHLLRHVQKLVLVHLSSRYSAPRAIQLLRDTLPPSLLSRTLVNLRSFGQPEFLTVPAEGRWGESQRTVAGWGWSQ